MRATRALIIRDRISGRRRTCLHRGSAGYVAHDNIAPPVLKCKAIFISMLGPWRPGATECLLNTRCHARRGNAYLGAEYHGALAPRPSPRNFAFERSCHSRFLSRMPSIGFRAKNLIYTRSHAPRGNAYLGAEYHGALAPRPLPRNF